MFNLIMRPFEWTSNRGTLRLERLFEHTEDDIADQYRRNGAPLFEKLRALPCLFMEEGHGDEIAHVGQILNARLAGREIIFEYFIDQEVPPLRNRTIYVNRLDLGITDDFEFSRNHWAVKEADLYRFLLRSVRPRRQRPKVFQIAEHEEIENKLLSAMMPFEKRFDSVYESISEAALLSALRCRRADDIWENPAIIQDVVSLIDKSRVVVCDCTGRNPNVFYEIGIAHTLGREVILITQNEEDIPFDLRHLRFIRYLNNVEGRAELCDALERRIGTILGN